MPRGESPTHALAYWFWDEILEGGMVVVPGLEEPVGFWEAERRYTVRYLGEAKKAISDGLNLPVLQETLRRIKASGTQPKDILIATKWKIGPDIAYDVVLAESMSPPPIYRGQELITWAQKWERQDWLDYLNEGKQDDPDPAIIP